MPKDGYRIMFERMLRHPLITVLLNTDFFKIRITSIPIKLSFPWVPSMLISISVMGRYPCAPSTSNGWKWTRCFISLVFAFIIHPMMIRVLWRSNTLPVKRTPVPSFPLSIRIPAETPFLSSPFRTEHGEVQSLS
jgi:hypothetical protein